MTAHPSLSPGKRKDSRVLTMVSHSALDGLKRHSVFFAAVLVAAAVVLMAQHLAMPSEAVGRNHVPPAGRDRFAGAQLAQQANQPDRAAVIAALDSAVNDGDLEGAMAQFASNAVFVGASRGAGGCSQSAPCTDPAGIRQQIQERNIAIHECFTLRNVSVSGAVVTGERYAQSDVTRRNGVDGDVENFLAVIPNNQITFFANVKNLGDPETARDLAISAGTQPAGSPIPMPPTPCAVAP
jgi:hypothetical protein